MMAPDLTSPTRGELPSSNLFLLIDKSPLRRLKSSLIRCVYRQQVRRHPQFWSPTWFGKGNISSPLTVIDLNLTAAI